MSTQSEFVNFCCLLCTEHLLKDSQLCGCSNIHQQTSQSSVSQYGLHKRQAGGIILHASGAHGDDAEGSLFSEIAGHRHYNLLCSCLQLLSGPAPPHALVQRGLICLRRERSTPDGLSRLCLGAFHSQHTPSLWICTSEKEGSTQPAFSDALSSVNFYPLLQTQIIFIQWPMVRKLTLADHRLFGVLCFHIWTSDFAAQRPRINVLFLFSAIIPACNSVSGSHQLTRQWGRGLTASI